ncbi:MAG: hypothetical protein IPO07_15850 [Haliscomenobacter sp.]|nr:hypothetical protein [Haliscomenobacter sp.]MBK9490074.1 hypothetical protein [Haliscomenobacter sp.]
MATLLSDQGYNLDFISDRQIQGLKVENGSIVTTKIRVLNRWYFRFVNILPRYCTGLTAARKQQALRIFLTSNCRQARSGWSGLRNGKKPCGSTLADSTHQNQLLNMVLSQQWVRRVPGGKD